MSNLKKMAEAAALAEGYADAMIVFNRDNIITYCNAMFVKIAGYEKSSECEGRSISNFIPSDLSHPHHNPMGKLKNGEMKRLCKTYLLKKDGSRLAVSVKRVVYELAGEYRYAGNIRIVE